MMMMMMMKKLKRKGGGGWKRDGERSNCHCHSQWFLLLLPKTAPHRDPRVFVIFLRREEEGMCVGQVITIIMGLKSSTLRGTFDLPFWVRLCCDEWNRELQTCSACIPHLPTCIILKCTSYHTQTVSLWSCVKLGFISCYTADLQAHLQHLCLTHI